MTSEYNNNDRDIPTIDMFYQEPEIYYMFNELAQDKHKDNGEIVRYTYTFKVENFPKSLEDSAFDKSCYWKFKVQAMSSKDIPYLKRGSTYYIDIPKKAFMTAYDRFPGRKKLNQYENYTLIIEFSRETKKKIKIHNIQYEETTFDPNDL